jgi:hypothetical protein
MRQRRLPACRIVVRQSAPAFVMMLSGFSCVRRQLDELTA